MRSKVCMWSGIGLFHKWCGERHFGESVRVREQPNAPFWEWAEPGKDALHHSQNDPSNSSGSRGFCLSELNLLKG